VIRLVDANRNHRKRGNGEGIEKRGIRACETRIPLTRIH
jgi:hypothetical protein